MAQFQREINGRHVLFILIAFFAVVVIANVLFVRFAVTTFPGEEVEKSYYQGIRFNDVLEERRVAGVSGWEIKLVSRPRAGVAAPLRFQMSNNALGAVPPDARLSGFVVRPMTDHGSVELKIRAMGRGVYESQPLSLSRGTWRLVVEAEIGTDNVVLDAQTRLLVQ